MDLKTIFLMLSFVCGSCFGGTALADLTELASNNTAPETGFTYTKDNELRNDLLTGYSAKSRPTEVTIINLNFKIFTINDLETRTQTFSVSGVFTIVWLDPRLEWDRNSYRGIRFIFSDETEVWRPALVVKNAVDNLSVISDRDIPFRITDGGVVFWNPPGIYETNCDIDTTYYPFDTQTCAVTVQSWGYNLRELDLGKHGKGVDTSEFQQNGEWDLVKAESRRSEKVDDTDANTYATVTFEFTLKRRSTYYGLNIILPVVVLSLLSTLVFILPADSGEKMGYSLTVLLAFAVFLTLISDRMPTTSKNTSYMAVYLSVVLCFGGLSVVLSMFTLHLHHRSDKVKAWIVHFTRVFLMPLVCARGCCGNAVSDVTSLPDDNAYPEKGMDGNVAQSDENFSAERETSWKDISGYLDTLFFRFFVVATVSVSVVFFTILGLGL